MKFLSVKETIVVFVVLFICFYALFPYKFDKGDAEKFVGESVKCCNVTTPTLAVENGSPEDANKIAQLQIFFDQSQRLGVNEEKDLNLFKNLLTALDKAANETGVQYFLSSGSLLGLYRHGGLIPWDDDLDVMVNIDNVTALVNKLNGTDGWHLLKFHNYYKLYSSINFAAMTSFTWTWPFLDLFQVESLPNNKLKTIGETFTFELQDIYPLQRRHFLGVFILVPKDIEKALVSEFGKDVRSQCRVSTWNHRLEVHVPVDPKGRLVHCKELIHLFNFTKECVSKMDT